MNDFLKLTNLLLHLFFVTAFLPCLSQTPDDSVHRAHYIGITPALYYPNYLFRQTSYDGLYNYLYLNRINFSGDFTYHYTSKKRIDLIIRSGIIDVGYNKIYNMDGFVERTSNMIKFHAQYWHALTAISYGLNKRVNCKQKTWQYFISVGNESAYLINNYYINIYDNYYGIHFRVKSKDMGWEKFYKYTNAMVAHIGFLKQLTKRLYTSFTLESRYFLLQPTGAGILKKHKTGVSLNGSLYVRINNL